MQRRPTPALVLILILAVLFGALAVGEALSSAPPSSKVAVDGLTFGVWGLLAWLIWVLQP